MGWIKGEGHVESGLMCRPLKHGQGSTHQGPKSTSVASAEARAASTRSRNECSALRHLVRVMVSVRVRSGFSVRGQWLGDGEMGAEKWSGFGFGLALR